MEGAYVLALPDRNVLTVETLSAEKDQYQRVVSIVQSRSEAGLTTPFFFFFFSSQDWKEITLHLSAK